MMGTQICKAFLKNIPHGYALFKVINGVKCELVECNQAFEKMFIIKDRNISDFISYIKLNNDILSTSLSDAIEYLINHRASEYVGSPSGYNIVLNKQTFDNEEYIFIVIMNISEKVQSHVKNYESFINSIDEMILVGDWDGNILFSNEAVRKKLGYTSEELEKMNILALHPEEKRKEAEEIFDDMLKRRREICPLPLAKKGGQYLPVETRVWFGEWDGKERLFSLSKDLSSEQEALQKFTKIFKRNPACMAITSLENRVYTQVNDAFIKTFGFSEKDVIGKTGIELKIFADVEAYEQASQELLSSESFVEKLIQTRKKNGDIVFGLFSGEIIESQDKKFIMTIMIDLTKQLNAEQELKGESELQALLLDLSSRYINCSLVNFDKEIQQSLEKVGRFVDADRVYIFDYDFNAGTTSNAYEWCRGFIEPEIENLQDILLERVPDWVSTHIQGRAFIVKDVASLDGETSSVKEILEAQGVKSLITIPMMLGDKCLGFVGFDSVRSHRIYTHGEIALLEFYAQILTNIHIRKQHELKLSAAEAKAISANNAKNLFIAKTSHELRNPLNGAWGFLNLLDDDMLTGKENEYLKKSKTALRSAIQIANDLIDISKMESNTFEISSNTINMRRLFKETMEPFIQQMEAQKIKLNIEIDQAVPQNLVSDHRRLKQIIGNLISNAIIHAQASIIEVGCEVQRQTLDSIDLLFYVKDNGIGIPREDQVKLFDSFYKKEIGSPGAGLGLSVVRDLVVKMGGEIKLKSLENEGSTFLFSLPFRIAKTQQIENTEDSKDLQDLSELQILVAEDDPINRTLILEMLKRKGASATVVSNGAELLQELESRRYDLILMDIQMPVMDGLEATKRIRESNNPIPIIALTAAVLSEEKAEYYNCGINGVVEKPIFIDSFIREIRLAFIYSNSAN